MEDIRTTYGNEQKKSVGATDREFTTGLFLLRCAELGLSMVDLDYVDVGMVIDMLIERGNDSEEDSYTIIATQDDFNRF